MTAKSLRAARLEGYLHSSASVAAVDHLIPGTYETRHLLPPSDDTPPSFSDHSSTRPTKLFKNRCIYRVSKESWTGKIHFLGFPWPEVSNILLVDWDNFALVSHKGKKAHPVSTLAMLRPPESKTPRHVPAPRSIESEGTGRPP